MNMKSLIKMRTLVLLLIVGSALTLGSCKKDPVVVDGDHTALTDWWHKHG